MASNEILDVNGLRRQVRNDIEFLAEQLDFFRQYYPNQLREINESIARDDATQLREWAHQLSGSLSSFHATDSRETARAIETCGRESRVADAVGLAPKLEQEIVELCDFVEALIPTL